MGIIRLIGSKTANLVPFVPFILPDKLPPDFAPAPAQNQAASFPGQGEALPLV